MILQPFLHLFIISRFDTNIHKVQWRSCFRRGERVLIHIAPGYQQGIADKLCISIHTVISHRKNYGEDRIKSRSG